MSLTFDILLDNLVSHITAATAEISPRPKMTSPIRLAQMRILAQQFVRRLSFELLHKTANGYLRRDGYKKMDVVFGYMTLDDINVFSLTDLSDHIAYSIRYRAFQNLLTIFRDPYHMQMDRKNCMRAMTVCVHGKNLTKPS